MNSTETAPIKLPKDVRDRVKSELWAAAELLGWDSLTPREKARHYQQWTDSEVGRTLAMHMDARSVRVFIKDSLLKDFSRVQLKRHQDRVLRLMAREKDEIEEVYIKPHGLRFHSDEFVAWGRADDWKSLTGALFERSYGLRQAKSALFFFKASPRYMSASSRRVVEDAASRLGVSNVYWFE